MKRKFSQEEAQQHMSGRIYINRHDSNIFVKRKGIVSWTMNLGNIYSWIIILGELLAIAALLWIFL